MDVSTPRLFPPARIVALALIVVLVGGLGYLRFAPRPAAVVVPEGAKAGQIFLKPCSYRTEDGSYAADCGTLVVPENRANPQSRLIALPVTRIRSRSGQPAEPVFRLEGGPGKTNMEFPMASRFAADRDVILVGYRGADGSVILDCPEVTSVRKHSTDFLDERSLDAAGTAFRSCADRLTREGVDLAGYSLSSRVDDLEAARTALGYDRIDLVSESAGTRYAMIYSWRYPKSVHRSVLIATNPPGHFIWDAKTTDQQIHRYADLCAKDQSCSARTDDLARTIAQTNRGIPGRWGFLPIKAGNVRIATFYGLFESTPAAGPMSAPVTLDSWLSAAHGDASGFWFSSLLADLAFPQSFVWGEMAAMGNADASAAHRYFADADRTAGTILGSPGTDFIWAGGRLADAWPTHSEDAQYDQVQTSNVETLVVGGELDFSTPPQVARKDLLPYLPHGHEVVLPGLGHSTSFWTEQPEASTRLIGTFFASGRIDDSGYQPISVDFTPNIRMPALAKWIAGAMIGLGLLTVVSLVAMAGRAHIHRRFGRKASAILRSLYAVVLGLGGWFVGVLIVLTTLPGVPVDNELLAAISVGVTTGLGVYFAWSDRARSATIRTVGLAASIGGALLGAWLGFHATQGFAALLTTLVGAVVGANLLLLVLDVADDRQSRVPLVAADRSSHQLLDQPVGAAQL